MKNIIKSNVLIPISFLILLFLRFFSIKYFPTTQVVPYIFFLLMFLFSKYSIKNEYAKLILLYTILLTLSCLYSFLFNGQSLITTFVNSFYYYSILFFFVLLYYRPSYKEVVKILLIVSLSFCVCYIIQWMIYPIELFGGAGHHTSEVSYRARMPGSICCYFLFMYGINRFLMHKNLKNASFIVLGFLPIIIQGFRSLVALTIASSFLIIPFVLKRGKKTIVYSICGVVIALGVSQTSLVQSKIEEMYERQETEQTFANNDYIRYIALDYYWNYYFTKPCEKIFGGGPPVDPSSEYTRQIKKMNESHLWIEDLGIVGLSMMIGIPTVLCLVIVYLLCIYRCKSPDLQYIRFTLLIVLLGSIMTSMEFYRQGNILLLSLFLYMEMKYNMEKNLDNKLKLDHGRKRFQRLLRMH